MVRQLTTFATEVTRVALEVGTQGILGGQAVVEGVEGVWDDLTTNVNVSQLKCRPSRSAECTENGRQSHRSSQRDCRSGTLLITSCGYGISLTLGLDQISRPRRLDQDGPSRCTGRDPGTKDYGQRYGGSTYRLCGRSHPSVARGRNRRQAGWSGSSTECRGYLAGFDRQCQLDGEQSLGEYS